MWTSVLSTTFKTPVWRTLGRLCTSVSTPLNNPPTSCSSHFMLIRTQPAFNVSRFNLLNSEYADKNSAMKPLVVLDFEKGSTLQSKVCSLQPLNRKPYSEVSLNIPPTVVEDEWLVSSVVKKRRLKMNKHKYRKRRKRDRQRSKQ